MQRQMEYTWESMFTTREYSTCYRMALLSLVVKQHAIKSGVEVASMILRIDDVVAAKSGEGPGGMGEGPGGELDEDTDF